ncbi:MAG: hypothetical protein R6V76_06780 [Desulfobacterales bacterium]
MLNNQSINLVWQERSNVIRKFIENMTNYKKLAEEVSYILKNKFSEVAVEYADITFRSKELNSFCEKIVRKNLSNPLEEVTDLAGVRIVYLYLNDRHKIEEIIENEFQIIQKVDKVSEQNPDRFGYGAMHYLVKIGKNSSGARYDDLKNLTCEIQVRTILQDAWAIVAHHISYKQESDVPDILKRKLNALAGLFETADDQFDRLREERSAYREDIKNNLESKSSTLLAQPINHDNLTVYLKWRFPEREHSDEETTVDLLNELNKFGYKKLIDLDNIITKSLTAAEMMEKDYPPFDKDTMEETRYLDVGMVRTALFLMDEIYLNSRNPSSKERQRIEKFKNFLSK